MPETLRYSAANITLESTQDSRDCGRTDGPFHFTRTNLNYSISVAGFGDKGVRKLMSDEILICTALSLTNPNIPPHLDFGIFAIFDGHGGKLAACFVKEHFVNEFASQLLCLEPTESIYDSLILRKVINATFLKLDSRIAVELPLCKDGCTAVIVFILDLLVITATLGDSSAHLARVMDDNTLHAIPLSETHKAWVIKEKERILNFGGTIENGRVNGALEVTRSFGDISLKKFGVLCTPTLRKFTIDLLKDKFILIGCDGLWNLWPAVEVIQYTHDLVQKETRRLLVEGFDSTIDVRGFCRELVEFAILDKKSQDNVSVLMILFQSSDGNKSDNKN